MNRYLCWNMDTELHAICQITEFDFFAPWTIISQLNNLMVVISLPLGTGSVEVHAR